MYALTSNPETSAFPLSVAIVNSEARTPVLFLHLKVDPASRKIKGNSELINPLCNLRNSSRLTNRSNSSKTELWGEYQSLHMMHKEDGHIVNLLGYPSYDQYCPSIKITLVTDTEWKSGRVCYEYLQNGEWLTMNNLNLKIK
jgi:hypothetical protein